VGGVAITSVCTNEGIKGVSAIWKAGEKVSSQQILSRNMQYWLFLIPSTLLKPAFLPAFCITEISIQPILHITTAKTSKGFGKEKGLSKKYSKSFTVLCSN